MSDSDVPNDIPISSLLPLVQNLFLIQQNWDQERRVLVAKLHEQQLALNTARSHFEHQLGQVRQLVEDERACFFQELRQVAEEKLTLQVQLQDVQAQLEIKQQEHGLLDKLLQETKAQMESATEKLKHTQWVGEEKENKRIELEQRIETLQTTVRQLQEDLRQQQIQHQQDRDAWQTSRQEWSQKESSWKAERDQLSRQLEQSHQQLEELQHEFEIRAAEANDKQRQEQNLMNLSQQHLEVERQLMEQQFNQRLMEMRATWEAEKSRLLKMAHQNQVNQRPPTKLHTLPQLALLASASTISSAAAPTLSSSSASPRTSLSVPAAPPNSSPPSSFTPLTTTSSSAFPSTSVSSFSAIPPEIDPNPHSLSPGESSPSVSLVQPLARAPSPRSTPLNVQSLLMPTQHFDMNRSLDSPLIAPGTVALPGESHNLEDPFISASSGIIKHC